MRIELDVDYRTEPVNVICDHCTRKCCVNHVCNGFTAEIQSCAIVGMYV